MKWIFVFTCFVLPCSLTVATAIMPTLPANFQAGQGVEIGQTAPTWKYLPGTDGKLHSSAEVQSAEACVVVFLCNKCPCSQGYERRINQLAKDFREANVKVIAVNANQGPLENLATMTSRAKDADYTYLRDAQQQLARKFAARSTPHAFVMNRHWKVVYSGAFDNDKSGKNVTQPYVRMVVDAVIQGTPIPVAQTKSIGCAITFQ